MEMVERIWLLQLELGMHEVSRAFSISDIKRSLASMIGRVYASCVKSSLIYGSETRPLLVDIWLKFEGAAMTMIRCKCVVSMKDISTSEELRKLVGLQPVTTAIRSGRLR